MPKMSTSLFDTTNQNKISKYLGINQNNHCDHRQHGQTTYTQAKIHKSICNNNENPRLRRKNVRKNSKS